MNIAERKKIWTKHCKNNADDYECDIDAIAKNNVSGRKLMLAHLIHPKRIIKDRVLGQVPDIIEFHTLFPILQDNNAVGSADDLINI